VFSCARDTVNNSDMLHQRLQASLASMSGVRFVTLRDSESATLGIPTCNPFNQS
jgi:hypothetical protein